MSESSNFGFEHLSNSRICIGNQQIAKASVTAITFRKYKIVE